MKIEAGKRYVRRDGKISGVIGVEGRPVLPEYKFSDGLLTYRQDGVYDEWLGVSIDDLISEYIEPAADTSDYQRGINDAVKWFNARNPHLLISITAKLIEKELK